MPYLIDGNNLIHAFAALADDIGRLGLCERLARLAETGHRVTVIFDGPRAPAGLAAQIDRLGLDVRYCPDGPADDAIIAQIRSDSAPRRLTVVSSDREIRKAARARRCTDMTSEDFARWLTELLAASPEHPGPREPSEKRDGLSPDQTQEWLNEFGLLDDNK
jgi:predicted RNA-binding protein with PIN domain